jgi:hypothetical protein
MRDYVNEIAAQEQARKNGAGYEGGFGGFHQKNQDQDMAYSQA